MPAPWEAGDRVKVSNQNSQHRNHLGVVTRVTDDHTFVRLDGHAAGAETLFVEEDLKDSTQEVPVEYA